MREALYIDGAWTSASSPVALQHINPATEECSDVIALAGATEVDLAVDAARRALPDYSRTDRQARLNLLQRIAAEYQRRQQDLATAITLDIGAPIAFAQGPQTLLGLMFLHAAIEALTSYAFEEPARETTIVREPIGVCGLITPWNYPVSLALSKIAPALAAGCTIVWKPSELAPHSACVLAEIIAAAGTPSGVFNMVLGSGPAVGAAMSAHSSIDMISFTGSTSAGIDVARRAAPTVKRVCQELGGKSPSIVLDADSIEGAVTATVAAVMMNSGQTCAAPTRLLAPRHRLTEVRRLAKAAAEAHVVGNPLDAVALGPVASQAQWQRVQNYIQSGLDEGAQLVTGGLGRPDGLEKGFFVKPTVFADATNDMQIAREEIFGPVLTIIGFDDVDHAVTIANDSDYGLAAFVWGADNDLARLTARRLKAGQVYLNGASFDFAAPFGGCKKSGNGREWGRYGIDEFVDIKAVVGDAH